MSWSDAVAVVLFFGVTAYAVFGGADFGAGFWDLIAGGATRGERPRAVIDHSIGPVWEANHVWLIFILVVLWTAFSEAFASITLTLFVPLTLAAFGIVLRGSSFVFRKAVFRTRDQRNFGAAFASSSVLVPYCMGAVAGAIASGRVPAGGEAGEPVSSWINPTSILGGVLAVTMCAYLAAVYLVWDSRRLHDEEMAEYFRRRAIAAGIIAGLIAFVGIFVLHSDARYVFDGLKSRALPFVILSALCGAGSLLLLFRNERGARAAVDRSSGCRGHRVGRGPVAVHAADELEGVAGRRARRHAPSGDRRLCDRRGDDPACPRVAVRARSEGRAARGRNRASGLI